MEAIIIETKPAVMSLAGVKASIVFLKKRNDYEVMLSTIRGFNKNTSPGEIESLAVASAHLSKIEQRRILEAIKDRTGMPISLLAGLTSDNEKTDDLSLAHDVLASVGRQNVIEDTKGTWMWDSRGVWRHCDDRTIKQAVMNQLKSDGRVSIKRGIVDSVTDILRTTILRPEHKFDAGDPDSVNTQTGEIELIDGQFKLMPHNREHYRTTQIPVAYNPEAKAPRFEQFLREIFPGEFGEDEGRAVLEMVGYTLMTHCRHEKFILAVGNGSNGKSVLLRVIADLLGADNISAVQPHEFGNRFQRGHLHCKLANIVTELPEGAVIDDAALKAIVSGEPCTVERKFGHPFEMTPYATLWLAANHMPHTRDFSDAVFRRAIVLKFEAKFSPDMPNFDPNLSSKLREELPGILNLALTAYAKALRDGFTMPESSRRAAAEWRLEADQVRQFVEECCETDSSGEEAVSGLYQRYTDWCVASGINKKLTMKSFRNRLAMMGFGSRRTTSARLMTGIRLARGGGGGGVVDYRMASGR